MLLLQVTRISYRQDQRRSIGLWIRKPRRRWAARPKTSSRSVPWRMAPSPISWRSYGPSCHPVVGRSRFRWSRPIAGQIVRMSREA